MYVLVSFTRANGHVIRPGLSLARAYHLLHRLGRGAIFRAEGMSVYARPIYPFPRHPADADVGRPRARLMAESLPVPIGRVA